jgi:hypothetical protein
LFSQILLNDMYLMFRISEWRSAILFRLRKFKLSSPPTNPASIQ